MGTLDDRVMVDLKEAMRSGDTVRRDVIRYLRAAFKNAQIARIQVPDDLDDASVVTDLQRAAERDEPLSDEEELAVLQRQIKQRQDAIEQFARAGRQDLVEREGGQLAILQEYLPAGLTPAEVETLVQTIIAETGAKGMRDMKLVMPVAMERAAGRADGRTLSEVVKRQLSAQ